MSTVDLNVDLAEADTFPDSDRSLLKVVSSATLACGGHAGSTTSMRDATRACIESGVAIGAHVSYRDRVGFGRRRIDVALAALTDEVAAQWTALADAAGRSGATVVYAKAHGALYHAMAEDPEVAEAVIGGLGPTCRAVVLPPACAGSEVVRGTDRMVVSEGFVDRGYRPSGHLVDRGQPGAMIESVNEAGEQARSLAIDGGVIAVDGTWVPMAVETLCLHGDHPGALDRAIAVRRTLEAADVAIGPFVDLGPRPNR